MTQTSFYEKLHPIRDRLFKQYDPDVAWEQLNQLLNSGTSPATEQEHRALVELTGLVLRAKSQYREAADLYRENGDRYQSGYCELLLGNLNATQSDWNLVLQSRNNHWCLTLYGMIGRQLNSYATVLQIRNHLESDVWNLLSANRWDYLQNIILYADILAQMNFESMKFLGRGILNYLLAQPPLVDMKNSPLAEQADNLLHRGQRLLPNDPEIYYHLGQFKMFCSEPDDARLMLNQCLLISPSYVPAKELLKSIQ